MDVEQSRSLQGDTSGITPNTCEIGNDYDGRMGLRVSSIFVIMAGSMTAALFPVLVMRSKTVGAKWERIAQRTFFIAKYFGSGVIIATAFIHLLAPAEEALRDDCLAGSISKYPWVEGIILMTIVAMFLVESMIMRHSSLDSSQQNEIVDNGDRCFGDVDTSGGWNQAKRHALMDENLRHPQQYQDTEMARGNLAFADDYAGQLVGVFVLEFGIIFHSIFIGLTLAVAGSEFDTLYIVLTFHQTFEGLGLGSRLAMIPWPSSRRWTPYVLAIAYGLTTPIAVAVGLGVRNTYPPSARSTLIVNGVFDAISAGILIYTGLIELIARDFLFSSFMRRAPLCTVWSAILLLCLGAGLMALLGRWA
ncbi:Putative Membrane zinc transporter [Aspergillus calidoustus]|uniref:Putative Membrane zinc transporter n=1 Tax=Aspergillus calidoustus TaxID=454130 RepID=A0A0U5GFI6_ASPCI|nr:Putative Membrane zinc transporter [Aspergillus calidoustus]CEL12002.1 Putative Membrane zinc transporter [Aspergillus calidoustus]